MRKSHVAIIAALTVASCSERAAQAQQDSAATPQPRYKAQPLNLHKEELGTNAYAIAARSRMKNGDCEGALDSFDAAIRSTTGDPTLFRDRGTCHDKLGHPYPAIDDYREYLTEAPEALDAEEIRKRLTKLEDDTSGRAPTTAASDDTDVPPVDTSVSGSSAASDSAGPPRDKMEYVEPDDDERTSPLRRGRGFSLAPVVSLKKWLFSGASFGDGQTWSESIGVQLRYSTGSHGAMVGEIGYERFNSTDADAFTVAGLTALVGYEFRIPLDAHFNNQVLIEPCVGYDHVSFAPTNPELQSSAANALVPGVRVGYRHIVATKAALDLALAVGESKWFVASGDGAPNLPVTTMVALNVGMAWGL